MKPFKTVYVTLCNRYITFPKEVQYLEDGHYICTGQMNNKYMASDRSLIKMTQKDFEEFIRTIHSAIYSEALRVIEFRNIEGDVPFLFYIFPNGQVRCEGYACTFYVPRNCLKWENVLIHGYYNDSYILYPCDKNGNVIVRGKKEFNPFSNNCNIVYNEIKNSPGISTSELIDKLGWPPNSVTSRLSELMSGGRISSVGRTLNPKTGRKVHKWMTNGDIEGACYVL